jgi:hypothetical protein
MPESLPPPGEVPVTLPPEPPPVHLHPHGVPWSHALAWYEQAMRLWKRAPAMWAALAVLTLGAELVTQAIPEAGPLLAKVVAPLVACGLLYASAAVDRGARPRFVHAVAAFRAGADAIAAIVLASLITFGAEAFAAWWIADANLMASDNSTADLTPMAIAGIYTIGILASLPITFVPMHVLYEKVPMGKAFAVSWSAFVQNTAPLLVYAAASLVLLGFGLATMGLGLVLVLPLWAASSYAAWKDIFGVRDAPDMS